MSVFGTILEKLGLHKHAETTHATSVPAAQPGSSTSTSAQRPSPTAGGQTQQHAGTAGAPAAQRQAGPAGAATPTPAQPQAMSNVDVTARLEKLAAGNPQKLNWRTSIVDLMKLLGMESSLAERKQLATELGYPSDQMNDTAKMNTWLHRQVLTKIAENGGNVPKELLN